MANSILQPAGNFEFAAVFQGVSLLPSARGTYDKGIDRIAAWVTPFSEDMPVPQSKDFFPPYTKLDAAGGDWELTFIPSPQLDAMNVLYVWFVASAGNEKVVKCPFFLKSPAFEPVVAAEK